MSFAEIKKAINSNLNKTLDALITEKASSLSTGISDNKAILNNSTYGLSALKTAINTVISNITGGKVPIVKSVQRGILTITASGTSDTISISTINSTKALVLLNGVKCSASNYDSYGFWLKSLSNTSLVIGRTDTFSSGSNGYISWQVIEFY